MSAKSIPRAKAARENLVRCYRCLAFDADGQWISSAAVAEADADLRRKLGTILKPEAVYDAFIEIMNLAFGEQ